MDHLSRMYRPITSKPKDTKTNIELLPCEALRPYIRCFWGTPLLEQHPSGQSYLNADSSLIIPDTCMDIVCRIDYVENRVESYFCGINDTPFYDVYSSKATVVTFGIRFYFWSVFLFADVSMEKALNAFVNVDEYFGDFKKRLENVLIKKTTIRERVTEVEKYLIDRIKPSRQLNHSVMNAVCYILKSKGLVSVSDICKTVATSQRHLGRLFLRYYGITPKKAIDLVRFQNVWQEMYYAKAHDFQDIVYEYGYYDQSHFTNDFKKYSGRPPLEVLIDAKKEVDFLQYNLHKRR